MKKYIFIFLIIFANSFSLKILTEESPPGSFYKKGVLTGSMVEIVREIQKRVGDTSEITVYPWSRAYNLLETSDDVALFATTRTAERETKFKWVGPLDKVTWIFVGKKDNNIKINKLEDAKKVKRIGAYRGDARAQFLENNGFKNVSLENNPESLFNLLHKNRYDLIITSEAGLNTHPKNLGIASSEFEIEYLIKSYSLYIAFSKGVSDDVVKKWQNALNELNNEGVVAKILNKYK